MCCGPCSIYPLKILKSERFDIMGYFYRNNIHPFTESEKRRQTLEAYAETIDLKIIYQQEYEPENFIRNVVFRESARCSYCYYDRLTHTAHIAKRGRFDCFSTTLLYSKFQKHDMIRDIGESVGKTLGVPFWYRDFRIGWKEGIEESKRLGMYRQQYCGCIYSEKERYFSKSIPRRS